MKVEADVLEDWAAQSFSQFGENYHSATTSWVVITRIQWKQRQNLCGPQCPDPPCYLTILLETTAVNPELPLRSLAVRTAVVTLKHLSSWEVQISQPWAIHRGFPRKGECQTPTQRKCQKQRAASWAQSVSHWSRVRGEVWDKEWRHLSYWLHGRADRPDMAPCCLFLSSLHTHAPGLMLPKKG